MRYEFVYKAIVDRSVFARFRPVAPAEGEDLSINVSLWDQLGSPELVEKDDETGHIIATIHVPDAIQPDDVVEEIEPIDVQPTPPAPEPEEPIVEEPFIGPVLPEPLPVDPQPVDEPVDEPVGDQSTEPVEVIIPSDVTPPPFEGPVPEVAPESTPESTPLPEHVPTPDTPIVEIASDIATSDPTGLA